MLRILKVEPTKYTNRLVCLQKKRVSKSESGLGFGGIIRNLILVILSLSCSLGFQLEILIKHRDVSL